MKKVLSLLVVLCMMFTAVPFATAADYSLAINNNAAVMVGNTNAIAWNMIVNIPVAPVEENGVVYVPAQFVASAFGGEYTYDAASGLVSINMGGERIAYLLVGKNYASVNGRIYISDNQPKVVDGQVMVPVQFMVETILGKHLYYDSANKLAVITQRKCLSSRDKDAISTISSAITSGVLPEIVIQAPVLEITSGGNSNAETGKLTFVSVSADQEPEPDNNGMCMIDGNLNSRWASQGAASAILDLGSAKPVTNIKVAVWKPNERSTNYSIEVSANGASYEKIYDGGSSGSTYDSYDVNDTIRYVRINTNGTTVGDWASILEVEAWNGTATTTVAVGGATGSVVTSPVGSKVSLTSNMVTVSQTPEAENHGGNLVDTDKYTVWASQGEASAVIDLGSAKTVSTVGVTTKMYDDDRTIPYKVEISTDGANYTQVWSGESDPQTDTTKYIAFSAAARYVRVTFMGNTVSGWNSVGGIEVYSSGAATGVTTPVTNTNTTASQGSVVTSASGTKVALTSNMLTASQTPEAENHAGNLVDGNKQTVWASQNEANVVIDLGSAKTLSSVGVAMKMYDDTRTIPYKIEVSTDGASYTEIWSGDSDPQTDTTKYVSTSASARYIKITAYGNTVSGWNSVAEVEVYTK
ncbi:MAG: discoidin domain-containing protein [Clostridia bacterium]